MVDLSSGGCERERLMPKLRVHKNSTYFVTLPKEYVEGLGWEKGDTLVVAPQGKRIVIENMNAGGEGE